MMMLITAVQVVLILLVLTASSVGVALALSQTNNRLGARKLQTTSTLPWETGALDYSDFFDTTEAHYGNCDQSNPVDAKAVSDKTCIERGGTCTVAWTKPGEWLAYDLYLDDSVTTMTTAVDITIRASSYNPSKQFRVRVEGGYEKVWNTPGKGYDVYSDFKWEGTPITAGILGSNLPLRIWVEFINGNINICAIHVEDSNSNAGPAPPPTGATRIKMWWQDGYFWQEETLDPFWCLECDDSSACRTRACDNVMLGTNDNTLFDFVPTGNGGSSSNDEYQIKDSATNMCLTAENYETEKVNMRMQTCDNSPGQVWWTVQDFLSSTEPFEIHPQGTLHGVSPRITTLRMARMLDSSGVD
jgi:muconolactone delta-isomerase